MGCLKGRACVDLEFTSKNCRQAGKPGIFIFLSWRGVFSFLHWIINVSPNCNVLFGWAAYDMSLGGGYLFMTPSLVLHTWLLPSLACVHTRNIILPSLLLDMLNSCVLKFDTSKHNWLSRTSADAMPGSQQLFLTNIYQSITVLHQWLRALKTKQKPETQGKLIEYFLLLWMHSHWHEWGGKNP